MTTLDDLDARLDVIDDAPFGKTRSRLVAVYCHECQTRLAVGDYERNTELTRLVDLAVIVAIRNPCCDAWT